MKSSPRGNTCRELAAALHKSVADFEIQQPKILNLLENRQKVNLIMDLNKIFVLCCFSSPINFLEVFVYISILCFQNFQTSPQKKPRFDTGLLNSLFTQNMGNYAYGTQRHVLQGLSDFYKANVLFMKKRGSKKKSGKCRHNYLFCQSK